MVTWLGFVAIAALVAALMGLTGLVLFIVGLAKKRTGLWVTGLVMGLGVLLLAMAGVAAMFLLGFGYVQRRGYNMVEVVEPAANGPADEREWYTLATGLDLPPETTCTFISTSRRGGGRFQVHMKLNVPHDYGRTLEAEFARVGERPPELTLPDGVSSGSWDVDGMRAPAYYQMMRTDYEGNAHATALAFDEATGTLYCAMTPSGVP